MNTPKPKLPRCPKPQRLWAIYNYGRIMAVEHRRKDLAKIFCGGEPEFEAHLKDGSCAVFRCTVTVIRRIRRPRKGGTK